MKLKLYYLSLFAFATINLLNAQAISEKDRAIARKLILDSLNRRIDIIDSLLKVSAAMRKSEPQQLEMLARLKEEQLNVVAAIDTIKSGPKQGTKTGSMANNTKTLEDTTKKETAKSTSVTQTKNEDKQKIEPKTKGKSKEEAKSEPKPEPKRYDNSKVDTIEHVGSNVYRIEFRGNKYDYLVVDLNKSKVCLHWKNQKGNKYNSIQSLLSDTTEMSKGSVQLITNGGMYTPESDPQGLFIEDGKEYRRLDTLKPANGDNFHLKPNGVFYLDSTGWQIDTTEFYAQRVKHKVQYATQSGPMLVINGAIHPAFKEGSMNVNVRSGVGIINNSKIVFAISVGETNFYDFAALFKYYLKCNNALYLDGTISKMFIPGLRDEDTGGHFGPIISVTEKTK